MSAPTQRFDKAALPSRHVTEGTINALQRVYFYAMGLDTEAIHQPFVGVASAWSGRGDAELRIADAAQAGVWAGRATPRRFVTIAGAQPSLLVRELVADSLELTVRGHSYDAVLGVTACPSALAGIALGGLRLDIPVTLVPLTDDSPRALALAAVLETLGLCLPSTTAGPATERSAQAAARQVCDLLATGDTARRFVDARALRNGALMAAAIGAEPDLLIDLVAMGREAGIDTDLAQLTAIAETAPACFGSPREALGRMTLPELVAELAAGAGFDLEARAGDGRPWADHATAATAAPTQAAAVRRLHGTLAPGGALVRSRHGATGTAIVFDGEDAACERLAAGWPAGAVVIVRGVGPAGGPGMPALDRLAETIRVSGAPAEALLVTDGRCGAIDGVTVVTAVEPEAVRGGPIAAVRDGDTITLDLAHGALAVDPPRQSTSPPEPPLSPVVSKYVATVAPASTGAMTHPGARMEVTRYADL